jgi:hypothetical protein
MPRATPPPAQPHEEIAAEEKIPERRPPAAPADHDERGGEQPGGHEQRIRHRILHRVDQGGRLRVAAPALAHEESSPMGQRHEEKAQEDHPVAGTQEGLRGWTDLGHPESAGPGEHHGPSRSRARAQGRQIARAGGSASDLRSDDDELAAPRADAGSRVRPRATPRRGPPTRRRAWSRPRGEAPASPGRAA